MFRFVSSALLFTLTFPALSWAQQSAPLPLSESAEKMTLPDGFKSTLFAGEPDVTQPIAFTLDHRGRMWVIECFSYPDWSEKKQDRILIFEDTDGDGQFDERKVFWDEGVNLSGIEIGFGGVWLCANPYFLFLPDADQNDEPDSEPVVLLDGWNIGEQRSKHNVHNGLTWGPDGWLYGLNGIQAISRIGKPGTADSERIDFNCGVWRYHPTEHRFEVVCHGTTNPWGLDFDQYGEMFITNCVIEHVWHVVPGAHFKRMYGEDADPHSYELIQSITDHLHWGGGNWTSSRVGLKKHDTAGGGHAHVGAMIYLGDNWPQEYRNGLYTLNVHGHRINHDLLELNESSYVAHHRDDFMFANDLWFRGLELKYGPDGGVFVTDWCDTGECHDYIDTQKQNGRIYKITYGDVRKPAPDLSALSDTELVQLHTHFNEWKVRHARQLLQERDASGKLIDKQETRKQLWKQFESEKEISQKLRAVWTVHAFGGLTEKQTLKLLKSESPHLRQWGIRLELDDYQTTPSTLHVLYELAKQDRSPQVRRELASALQRLPHRQRWPIARELVEDEVPQEDLYRTLMTWYGIHEAVAEEPILGIRLLKIAHSPKLKQFIARRLAEEPSLFSMLAECQDNELIIEILRGIQAAHAGQPHVSQPKLWKEIVQKQQQNENPEIRLLLQLLSLQYGLPEAPQQLRTLFTNQEEPVASRLAALTALSQQKDPELPPLLFNALDEEPIRRAVLNSLAVYDSPETPNQIFTRFDQMTPEDQQAAIGTLISRPGYALALLTAIEQKKIPRNSLTAFSARQLLNLNQDAVTQKLEQVWGVIGKTDEAKTKRMAELSKLFTPDNISNADASRGRLLFSKSCGTCHKLFGEGAAIGPELTGSQRTNNEYLIQNLIDPNALVGKDFQMTVFVTEEGRTISGIVQTENDDTVTIQSPTEKITLSQQEIEVRKASTLSLMPEGLLDQLNEQQILDLVAYLKSEQQVALPPAEN